MCIRGDLGFWVCLKLQTQNEWCPSDPPKKQKTKSLTEAALLFLAGGFPNLDALFRFLPENPSMGTRLQVASVPAPRALPKAEFTSWA